jgi:hypothetical protein
MFWTKVVEKIKTHILCSTTFFRKSHRLWDNVEKCSGDRGATNDVTIWRIRVACWISKAICTQAHAHTNQYVILIAFPRQQWFHERASMLRYTYMACLVALTSTITHFTFIITALHWYCNFHRTSTQTDHTILYAGRKVGWKSIYVTSRET